MNIFEKIVIAYVAIWLGVALNILFGTLLIFSGLMSLGWFSMLLFLALLVGWVFGTVKLYAWLGRKYVQYKQRRNKVGGAV